MLIPVRVLGGDTVYATIDEADSALSMRSWRLHKGYVVTRVYAGKRNGRSFQRNRSLHRIILGLACGDIRECDHINRDPLDNRRCNLRVVNRHENAQNSGSHRRWNAEDKDSGLRGVHWDKAARKWKASARLRGKLYALGYYDNPGEAGAVVSDWRRENMTHSVER